MATANAEDVAKRLREVVARWDRDHLERYLAMLDPSFEIDDPTFPLKGKEAVRRINEGLLDTFPDLAFEILIMAASDNVVAGEIKLSFTFNGPLKLPHTTVSPTGRHHELTYAAFYRFNSQGLLTSVHNYGLDLERALGIKG